MREPLSYPTLQIGAETDMSKSYLDELQLEMYGHRKKALFFIRCLQEYAVRHGIQASGVRVLEFGCGNGRNVALPVAERGFWVTGVDSHQPSVQAARAYNRLPNVTFICSDFAAFRSDKPYNVVILSDILEHIQDPKHLLKHSLSYLTADGIILISIPNGYGPFEIERYLVRIGLLKPLLGAIHLLGTIKRKILGQSIPPRPAYNDECGHIQFFTLSAFHRLLGQTGIKIVRQANGCWFGSDLTSYLFRYLPPLIQFNLSIADRLPPSMVSTWYFECSPIRA